MRAGARIRGLRRRSRTSRYRVARVRFSRCPCHKLVHRICPAAFSYEYCGYMRLAMVCLMVALVACVAGEPARRSRWPTHRTEKDQKIEGLLSRVDKPE